MSDKETEETNDMGTPQRTSQRKGKGTDLRVHFKDDMVLQQQRARTPNKQVNTDNEDMNNRSSDMNNVMVSSVVALTVHHGMDVHNNNHSDNGSLQPN